MKHLYYIFLLVLLCGCARTSGDFSIKQSHPRLFTDGQGLQKMKRDIEKGKNLPLLSLHNMEMAAADSSMKKAARFADTVEYVWSTDAAGKRLLTTHRAACELTPCIYAYKMTGDRKYLERVEKAVLELCALPGWNPPHYLDVASGSFVCSMAYDWLFDDLQSSTKETILNTLRTNVIEAASDPCCEHLVRKVNNWGQVCNGGIILAAICLEDKEALKAAVVRSHNAFDTMLAPDGIYPEGPGYFNYGGGWQVATVSALESACGDDFGFLSVKGFDKCGQFLLHCNGTTGVSFNYSDNEENIMKYPLLWFLVDKFKDRSILYYEMQRSTEYSDKNSGYIDDFKFPVYLIYASRYDGKPIPEPKEKLFCGHGQTPLIIARTGWQKDDLYLALKGGNPVNGHAHMDNGSFIFEAFGYRWSSDPSKGSYPYYESHFPSRRNLWAKTPESPRWQLFAYNNKQHSTLTIGGQDHDVTGYADVVSIVDKPGEIGGTINLVNCFKGMVNKSLRTALLKDGSGLEITDDILMSEDWEGEIRWTLYTAAETEIVEDGILLKQGDVTMKLSTSNPSVKWQTWSNDPADYKDNPYGSWDRKQLSHRICGFTYDAKKAEQIRFVTTISKM